MAKTTSNDKAKTKTTKKKPTTVAAAKTKAVKSAVKTKAPVKTKAVAKKDPVAKKDIKKTVASKAAVTKNSSFVEIINRPFVIAGLLFALLAGVAGALMSSVSSQVFIGHLAKDELASRGGTVLAPAAYPFYELEIKWLLVGLLVVSAAFAFARGTRYYAREVAAHKSGVNSLRWIDFAVTGSIAFSLVGLLNGVQDLVALKLSAAFIMIAALLAWIYERENVATKKPSRSVYIASAVAIALPVIFLVFTMYSSFVYGMSRSPWYAYAAAVVVALGLLLTIRGTQASAKQQIAPAAAEKRYNQVALLTKVLLAVILIVGLYAK